MKHPLVSLLGALLPYMSVILSVLGLFSLITAAFIVGMIAGFVVLGVSFLVMAFYAEQLGT